MEPASVKVVESSDANLFRWGTVFPAEVAGSVPNCDSTSASRPCSGNTSGACSGSNSDADARARAKDAPIYLEDVLEHPQRFIDEFKSMRRRVKEVTLQRDAYGDEAARCQQALGEYQMQLDDYHHQSGFRRTKIKMLEEKVEYAIEDNKVLEAELARKSAQILAQSKAQDQYNEKLEIIYSRMAQVQERAQKRIEDLQEEIDALQEKNDSLQEKNDSLQEKCTILEGQVHTQETEIEVLRKEKEDSKKRVLCVDRAVGPARKMMMLSDKVIRDCRPRLNPATLCDRKQFRTMIALRTSINKIETRLHSMLHDVPGQVARYA